MPQACKYLSVSYLLSINKYYVHYPYILLYNHIFMRPLIEPADISTLNPWDKVISSHKNLY